MARTIARRRGRRRRVGRSASGRFVSRSRPRVRRRRRGRNPSGYVKVGRRWRKMTKYARRRKRGRRRGQIRGFRFPRSYRRRRRRVRHNPPRSDANPRRRRRRVRHNARRRRYYRRNPGRTVRLSADPIGAIKAALSDAFSMDTLEALFHTALGFGGVATLGKIVYKKVIPSFGESGIGRVGTMIGTTIIGSALAGVLTKNRSLTTRVLAGGLLATLWQGLTEILPDSAKEFIPTLGEAPETEEFRKAIEKEVLRELRGGGVQEYLPAAGAEGFSEYIQPAGIEQTYLTPAGQETYLTAAEGEGAMMGSYLTEREVERVEAQPSGVGEAFDEFSRTAMAERF
ncbi:MAG: hypothetical protein ACRD1P_11565 [Thermoanaerobaculia bacterium]